MIIFYSSRCFRTQEKTKPEITSDKNHQAINIGMQNLCANYLAKQYDFSVAHEPDFY